MPTELTVVLWFDDDVPIPTNEEVEEALDCHVREREEEEV